MYVEGKEADYELVAKADVLQLYTGDHGKPMNVSKASAKVTLLSGSEKHEAVLTPAGDKLEANGDFKVGAGTKAVAVVTNAGKTFGGSLHSKIKMKFGGNRWLVGAAHRNSIAVGIKLAGPSFQVFRGWAVHSPPTPRRLY